MLGQPQELREQDAKHISICELDPRWGRNLCPNEYMHACMHSCMHAWRHACILACIHVCIHIYMHAGRQACMHAGIGMHRYIHTCIHACIHTYVRTYIHTYTRTCAHSHTNTKGTWLNNPDTELHVHCTEDGTWRPRARRALMARSASSRLDLERGQSSQGLGTKCPLKKTLWSVPGTQKYYVRS